MPIIGITIEADSVVVKGSDFDALCGLASENNRLRQELSLAEEGLANYAQEIGQLKEQVSALSIEVETARNAAKDIARETERLRSGLTACQLERDRLRAGLLGHTCFCGPTDPDPSVHREDCPYRKWASRDPQTAPTSDGE